MEQAGRGEPGREGPTKGGGTGAYLKNTPLSAGSAGWIRRLEFLERWGYLTIGLSFLLIGMINFAHAWLTFLLTVRQSGLQSLLILTHDLLFVLILLELFRTVLNFLKSHIITLEPFLYIGIIAATRKILIGGAELGTLKEPSPEIFDRYLWDMGLNTGVVVMLVAAVFLYNRIKRPGLPNA